MARFLAYTSPARGHLYPITPTLLELAGRGHDVHVRRCHRR
jgi:UDP:flavonoid glycosyltransferase YjiC (YdhE family)